MNQQRRDALKAGAGLGLAGILAAIGLLRPEVAAAAWNRAAFEAKSLDAVFAGLGAARPADSADIRITAPDIAENGAVVSIGVSSSLPATEQIAIVIEKNPNLLAANFTLPEGTLPEVQTRVKMAETSNIHVVVKAGGKFYVSKREVQVTIGGCGN